MKKVNYKKILILTLFLVITFLIFREPILADTGFDTDLDISFNDNIILYLLMYVFYCFVRVASFNANFSQVLVTFSSIGLVVLLFYRLFKLSENPYKIRNKPMTQEEIYNIKRMMDNQYPIIYDDDIIKVYPEFNRKEFIKMARKYYIDLQVAWTNFDYDKIKSITSHELYEVYKSGLDSLKEKNQINIVSDIKIYWIDFIKVEKNDDEINITIMYDVAQKDYIINDKRKIVKGIFNRRRFSYLVTFSKTINKKDIKKCPSCGAPLDDIKDNKCKHCNSVIVNKNHDWVITNKLVTKEIMIMR